MIDRAYVITGTSRIEPDRAVLRASLEMLPTGLLIHGDAKGVDRAAAAIWESMGRPTMAFPARWQQLGAAAGRRRNLAMLSVLDTMRVYGVITRVIGFPSSASVGTWHCLKAAENMGFDRTIVLLEG